MIRKIYIPNTDITIARGTTEEASHYVAAYVLDDILGSDRYKLIRMRRSGELCVGSCIPTSEHISQPINQAINDGFVFADLSKPLKEKLFSSNDQRIVRRTKARIIAVLAGPTARLRIDGDTLQQPFDRSTLDRAQPDELSFRVALLFGYAKKGSLHGIPERNVRKWIAGEIQSQLSFIDQHVMTIEGVGTSIRHQSEEFMAITARFVDAVWPAIVILAAKLSDLLCATAEEVELLASEANTIIRPILDERRTDIQKVLGDLLTLRASF